METKELKSEFNFTGVELSNIYWDGLVEYFSEEQTPIEAAITLRKVIGHLAYCILQFDADNYIKLDVENIQNDIFFVSLLASALEGADKKAHNNIKWDLIAKKQIKK